MSLNTRKYVFETNKGKLLGHIVSKDGLNIDLERVKEILSLPLPNHKNRLQNFPGRINFVRRFIPSLASMLKPLIYMLKKNISFSWKREGKASFEEIKEAISSAPNLIRISFSIPLVVSQAYQQF